MTEDLWREGRPPPRCHRTKNDEPGVGVGGAQGVLGGAAVHGAVELGWHPLQHQLLAIVLCAAIEEPAPHPGPGKEGLGEDFILWGDGALSDGCRW